MLAFDGEAGQCGKTVAERRFRKCREGGNRQISLGLREPRSVLKAPGRFNCSEDGAELLAATALDGGTDEARDPGITHAQGVDQRERRLALGQVLTEVLAPGLGVGAVVQHIIYELVGGAQM